MHIVIHDQGWMGSLYAQLVYSHWSFGTSHPFIRRHGIRIARKRPPFSNITVSCKWGPSPTYLLISDKASNLLLRNTAQVACRLQEHACLVPRIPSEPRNMTETGKEIKTARGSSCRPPSVHGGRRPSHSVDKKIIQVALHTWLPRLFSTPLSISP